MKQNFLQLNSSKTEAILVGTPNQVWSSVVTGITFLGQDIPLPPSATPISLSRPTSSICLKPPFSPQKHCQTPSHAHFGRHRKACPCLHLLQAGLLQCTPHRDSWQKSPETAIHPEQCCLILMRVRKHDHITPILRSLHWLPVSFRIEYKGSLLTQCLHSNSPPLKVLSPHKPPHGPSDLLKNIYSNHHELSCVPWELWLSAPPLPVCGMLSLIT